MRLPTFFIPHGGGPCFFMEWTMGPPDTWDSLRGWLEGLIASLDERPSAIVVASAHWEADPVRVTAMESPALVYDYGGFPPHTYELTWPAPGSPRLAARIQALLGHAGIDAELEDERGFDHGVFVPLKVMLPDADIPTLAMSLRPDLDPAFHHRLGAALAPLRDEGVLILGSGNSYHNTQGMMTGGGAEASARFDDWLVEAVVAPGEARERALSRWEAAPDAREAHPREEHLIPLMIAAGAARDEPGARVFSDVIMSAAISAIRFGDIS